jgi:hypothetical protein
MRTEKDPKDVEAGRRALLATMTGLAAGVSADATANAQAAGAPENPVSAGGYVDPRSHFGAVGDGKSDDTSALERSIALGSQRQWPILLGPGAYLTSRSLHIPSNTMIRGTSYGLGFGCRIEPHDCAAFVVGGNTTTFHASIENVMIWPQGGPAEFVISVENSYSVKFRNVRIHNAHPKTRRAAIVLDGREGRCNDVLWERLIVRNDVDMGSIAILAEPGCGTHRFFDPSMENYVTLLEWRGGELDLFAPYTERAGRFGIHCNNADNDAAARLNTYGGVVSTAESAVACAIESISGMFNSFGTLWAPDSSRAIYVYSVPKGTATFSGSEPNLSGVGRGQCAGVEGWSERLRFPGHILRNSVQVDRSCGPRETVSIDIDIPGALPRLYRSRVNMDVGRAQILLSAQISAPNKVTVIIYNPGEKEINLSGRLSVSCSLT